MECQNQNDNSDNYREEVCKIYESNKTKQKNTWKISDI